jgi:ABC-2 type transport system ATP-binding protein
MEEADSLCDRLAIIDHGKIAVEGTPKGLKAALGGDLVTLVGASRADVEKLPFVKKVEEKGAQLVLTVENAPANLPRLVQAAGSVESVEVRPARLEDVFIAHTGRSMRDAEEGGEDWMEQFVQSQRGE